MFKKISKTEYKDLLNKALFKTFFHEVEWHEFLEKEFKWLKPASPDASQGGFEYYTYKDEALLPIAKFKVFGKEKLISLPFCEYGGPLPLKTEINFEEFEKNTLSEFGENIKIKFHPGILKYFNKFPTSNIKHQTSDTDVSSPESQTSNIVTFWIENLKSVSEEKLLASFRKTLRYEIRDAGQRDFLVRKCENSEELERFYDLYVVNLRRKKTVPYPYPVFEFLYSNPDVEIILAFLKGRIICGNLFINYNNFVHYFFSASDNSYKEYGAAYLLLWSKIKTLIGQDKILDLGATPKNSSLEIFKRGWGGKEYPILQIGTKKSEEVLRSSKLRSIWGLLPDFVIKRLSSRLIKYRL